MQCSRCTKCARGACSQCRRAVFCSAGCYTESGHAACCPRTELALGVRVNEAPAGAPVHLVVLLHGLQAKPTQMQPIADALTRAAAPAGVRVHLLLPDAVATTFWAPRATFSGIDVGGQALAAAIVQYATAQGLPRETRLSFVGHSLGGLYARFAIGCFEALGWFAPTRGVLEATTARFRPGHYVSLATPHLGASKDPASLGGLHRLLAGALSAHVFQRTGHQIGLLDGGAAAQDPMPSEALAGGLGALTAAELGRVVGGANERRGRADRVPLLVEMSAPGSVHMQGLRRFTSHTLYANIRDDIQVGYTSAAILSINPYTKMTMTNATAEDFLPAYPHLVAPRSIALHHPEGARLVRDGVPEHAYQAHLQGPLQIAFASEPDAQIRAWLRTMLANLQQFAWRRYDAYIPIPLLAHDAIVGWYGGADIVQHLADHFVF
jgi:hypothetical protein